MKDQISDMPRPLKSISARSFGRNQQSKDKKQQKIRRLRLKTQLQEHQTFATTQRHLALFPQTSRLAKYNSKNQTISFLKPQELKEQNQQLKMKVNKLAEELTHEKSKHLKEVKSIARIQKDFDIQFEHERYYEDTQKINKNIIEGVKYQYNKMKRMYEEKKEQYDSLLKNTTTTALEELKIYCKNLEMENSKLKQYLKKMVKYEQFYFQKYRQSERSKYDELKKQENDRKKRNNQLDRKEISDLGVTMSELNQKLEDGEAIKRRYKERVRQLNKRIESQNRKILFLDKLLIEKKNESYNSNKRQRRLGKEIKKYEETISLLQKQMEELKSQYSSEIQKVRQKQDKKVEIQKVIFKKHMDKKQQTIQKLQHEVNYLSTIISYLKVGEDIKLDSPKNLSNKLSQNSKDLLLNLEKSMSLADSEAISLTNRKRVKTIIENDLKQLSNSRQVNNTEPFKTLKIGSDDEQGFSEEEDDLNIDHGIVMSRIVKSSHFKHNEKAQKKRHVKLSQIQQFKFELVYRFIHYRLARNQVKQYLNYKSNKEEQDKMTRNNKLWNKMYINMKQILEILCKYPFDLDEYQSLLLARYIVEDATHEDVYCQETNQIERTIAKSILAAFIGEYKLPDQIKSKEEWQSIIERYGKNLNSALTSLAPTGIISSVKLLEICQSIQIEISQDTKNWILSLLLSKSGKQLSKLQYKHLFE